MSNVSNVEDIHACASRSSKRIPDDRAAARMEKLGYAHLFKNERNFRPANPEELNGAPHYIHAALERGETILMFVPTRSALQRLNTVAQRVADTCKLAGAIAATPSEAAAIANAREFLRKIDRADFETIARKSLIYARTYAHWRNVREHVCPPGEVRATQGRVWRRVTTLGELQDVGRHFVNCLARTSIAGAYGAGLVEGQLQFWVLRDGNGKGLIVACAPAHAPTDFREVKGPRNVAVSRNNPDLVLLARHILAPEQDPPTPVPPTPAALIERHFPSNIALEDLVCTPIGLGPVHLQMHLVELRPPLRRRRRQAS